jgi:hypothetical protein
MEKQVQVVTAGRRDIADYFSLHVGKTGKLPHSPLLVFQRSEAGVSVEIVLKPVELMGYPDDTPVMGIWPGQWRSDYFQFTVGEYRAFFEGLDGGKRVSGLFVNKEP